MWGTSIRSQQFAEDLIDSVNKDVFGLVDDKDYDAKKKGLIVQAKDKAIAVFTDFEGFDMGVWMEDERDIMFQIYPPRHRAKFQDMNKFLAASEQPFSKVFDGICEIAAEYYRHTTPKTHRVSLVHNRKRRGMDLLEIRLQGLYRVPSWRETMVDVMKLLEKTCRQLARNEAMA
jgi:hypothetical protein